MSRLINTEEFIKRIDHYPSDIRDTAKKELRYCKTVDAVPVVHGKWIKIGSQDSIRNMKCSICGEEVFGDVDTEKYCFNCGAKMDEVTE